MEDLFNIRAIIGSLVRRWWLPVLCLAAGAAVSVGITRRLPKIYRASTLILVEPQKIPVAYVRPTVTTSVENRLRSLHQQITSRSRIERVIEDLALFPDKIGKIPMEVLVNAVSARIQLEVRGNNTFRIYYEGTDPQLVARVANKVADLYIEENIAARQREARTTSEFLDKELEKVRQRLEAEEELIARFKREHMGELPEQRDSNLRTLEALQSRLRTNSEALTRARDRRLMLEEQLASQPASITDANQVALLLEQARERLRQMETQYTDRHPEVALQRREIKRLEDLLASDPGPDPDHPPAAASSVYEVRLRTDLEGVELEIKSLEAEQLQIRADIAKYQERVENAPKNEAFLSTLTRDYANLQRSYESLLGKRLEADLAEKLERELQGEQFIIVDRAVPPALPYRPNLTQIVAIGSAVGLMLGCALTIAVDVVRPRFRTEEELAAAHGIAVLAAIPRIDTQAIRRRRRSMRRLLLGSGLAVVVAGAMFAVLLFTYL